MYNNNNNKFIFKILCECFDLQPVSNAFYFFLYRYTHHICRTCIAYLHTRDAFQPTYDNIPFVLGIPALASGRNAILNATANALYALSAR